MEIDKDFFVEESRRKKIFASIGIVLAFSLVSTLAYSANSTFVNLNSEIELMETDIHNLQIVFNSTCVELNFTKDTLTQSIEEKLYLQDELNVSIEEKATLQNTLTQTEEDLFESIKETSVLQDRLTPTSPPTTVTKTNQSRLLVLIADRFNTSRTQIHTLDRNYSLTTKSEMERFLSRDIEIHGRFKYVTEIYDCDDFALRTYGELSVPGWSDLAIGVVSFKTGNHSSHMTLLFFDIDEKIWMLDYFKVKEIPDNWILKYVLI